MLKVDYIKKQNIIYLLVIITSYLLLFQNLLWLSFTDEDENINGGWLISNGYVLYRDIFAQRMPFPFYYASLLIKLGLNDVSGLRLGMSLTILFFWLLIIVIFKEKINYKLLCSLIILSAIAHPLFWGHMLLADSFFAYSILIIFLYFFSNPQLDFNIKDKIIIASMIYISIMSALVSILPILVLGIYYILKKSTQFHIEKTNTNIKNKLTSEIKFGFIILTPFILSLIFFYSTDSLQQFFYQAYLFNKIYFSQFNSQANDPQLFVLIKAYSNYIFYYFSNIDWLINEKSFNWAMTSSTPLFFEGFLVISNLIVLVLFWKRNLSLLAISYVFLLAFLRWRDGFHLAPYYLLSFFSVSLIITEVYEFFAYKLRYSHQLTPKIKFGFMFIPIVSYSFLAIILVGVLSCAYVSNGSGMGAVQNSAHTSYYDKIITTLTQPNDTIWIAPFDPSRYFINDRLPASKYTYYLPCHAKSSIINEELIEDLKVKKPPLIIFDRDADIWGYVVKDYGKTVDHYIQQNYYQVDPDDPIYKNIYLINSRRTQLLKTLYDKGLYEPIDAKQLDKSAHIGEIIAGLKVIQTFTPLKPRVNRIDLMLATFARKNHGKIIFHLKENSTGNDIYNKTEDISEIRDNSWYTIYFPPFNDSMIGKRIYLVIEAPESKHGDAITIYSSKNETYKMGELYINDQSTGKDLTFATHWNTYLNTPDQ